MSRTAACRDCRQLITLLQITLSGGEPQMRTVGLLGGMSWQSTQIYYKLINEDVQARKGGLHSAPLLIKSFDFAEIMIAINLLKGGKL